MGVFSDGISRSLLFISKLNDFSPKSLPTFFVKREETPRMVRVKLASEARRPSNRRFKKMRGGNPAAFFYRNFAFSPIFLGTERVSGKKVPDLFC